MDDLISRQEAIEVADAVWCVTGDVNVAKVWDQLKNLPSAQPDTKAQLPGEGTTSDLISRQAAIDALGERPLVWTDDNQYALGERNQYDMNRLAIETLPSAHPEIEERKEESAQNVPKEDLISRKAAIDSLDSFILDETTNLQGDSVREILESLPSAQPEPQWNLCSDRLPEVGRSVLFSRRNIGTREGCLQADGKWWQYRWNEMLNADQVTAWMPLPEPYREERRTDE